MAYFPRLRQVVLFGGAEFGSLDDTWVWNGALWRTKAFEPHPPARGATGMVYDPVLKGVLLFAGSNGSNDTWLFR
jgi:hypothetical protein